jgi:hypothetical protein
LEICGAAGIAGFYPDRLRDHGGVKGTKAPTLNTSGIKRIAIMPFEYASYGSVYSELAQYAATVADMTVPYVNLLLVIGGRYRLLAAGMFFGWKPLISLKPSRLG